MDGNAQTANWADYTCLGVDDIAVYVAANMFSDAGSFQHPKNWVVPKSQLLSGTLTSWTEFIDPPGSRGSANQPAHVFGNAPKEYILSEQWSVRGSSPLRKMLRVTSIDFPQGVPVWTDMGYIEVAHYPSGATPDAPQAGGSTLIDTGDQRLKYELDYWATSYREAALYLNENAPKGARVAVFGPVEIVSPYTRPDIRLNIGAVARKLKESQNAEFNYAIILNRRNAAEEACRNAETIKTVELDGALLMIVKEIPPGQIDCP